MTRISKHKGFRDFTSTGKQITAKKKRNRSMSQEDRYGDRDEMGFRIPMSGAGDYKGDALYKGYLLECKRTDTNSYSLEYEDLKESYRESKMADYKWAFAIDIDNLIDDLPNRFVLLPTEEFEVMAGHPPFIGPISHRNKSYGFTENRIKSWYMDFIDEGYGQYFSVEIDFKRFKSLFSPQRVTMITENDFISFTEDKDGQTG